VYNTFADTYGAHKWPALCRMPASAVLIAPEIKFTEAMDSDSAHYQWRTSSHNHAQLYVDPAVTVFNQSNWDQHQTVRVVALDDSVAELPRLRTFELVHPVFSTDPHFQQSSVKWFTRGGAQEDETLSELAANTVTCSLTDDDTAGIAISEGILRVFRGGVPVMYNVHLAAQPIADVTVTTSHSCHSLPETSGQLEVVPARLVFTQSNWNEPQSVQVAGLKGTRNCEFAQHSSPHSTLSFHLSPTTLPPTTLPPTLQLALSFTTLHLPSTPSPSSPYLSRTSRSPLSHLTPNTKAV
jgi:hypothetical protein